MLRLLLLQQRSLTHSLTDSMTHALSLSLSLCSLSRSSGRADAGVENSAQKLSDAGGRRGLPLAVRP